MRRDDQTFDYIIAGAGTAGCILARRLIERTDASVLLLEAGPRYSRLMLDAPLPSGRVGRTFLSWGFRTVPQAHLEGRTVAYPMGRVVGGSSSINAMIGVWGLGRGAAEWQRAGGEGWSEAALAACADRAFGSGGVLKIAPPRHRAPFSEAFLAACDDFGLERDDLLTTPRAGRSGYYGMLQQDGRRYAAARGYLGPVARDRRLSIMTGARVRRLLLKSGRVTGVEYRWRGRTMTAHADRETILALGTFESPRALMTSGIGAVEALRVAGIPVLHDLQGVGSGLADHPRIPVLFRSGQPSPALSRKLPAGAARYLMHRDGVFASTCCESGAFLGEGGDPALQIITHFQSVQDSGAVDVEVSLLRVESRGSVRLDPSNPFGAPLIDPGYLSAPDDVATLADGIEQVRALAARPALADFPLDGEIAPGQAARSMEALRAYVRQTATTAFHPVGTCRMGTDEYAVVDGTLRVRGVENLRIADASVMPSLPPGNTACPTMVIAEKAADLLTGR